MLNILYIVWKAENDTGIAIIDEQHRAIVATINSLYYFIQEGWGISALAPTLSIIKSYSAFHSKTEEGMLGKQGCPDVLAHDLMHKKFVRDLDEVAHEAIAYRDPSLLLRFLRDWWINHLVKEHPHYEEYWQKLRD